MQLENFDLKGRGLKSSDIKNGNVLTLPFQPKLKYSWDTGRAIGAYLDALKLGKLIGRHCKGCNRIMIPPRMFCELCFKPTDDWVDLKDTGTVNTFSICHVNWDASRLPPDAKRHLPAVIEIDGASEGMGILHILGDVDPKDVKIGMKVKAVWKPANERTGAITDISYFRPETRDRRPETGDLRPETGDLRPETGDLRPETGDRKSIVNNEPTVKTWDGEIPVHYLYTYGVAGEKFFREIKDNGTFVATHCADCNVTYVPPRIYCERCLSELKSFKDVGIKGTIETFTICHESIENKKLSKPEIIVCARIAGTNGGVVHKMSGVEPANVKIGMKVEAVFAPKDKRTGHIADILHFRPI